MTIESDSYFPLLESLDDLEHAVIDLQGLIGALALVAENLPLRRGEGGTEWQAANALLPLLTTVSEHTEGLLAKIKHASGLAQVAS
jgi:hypothetical protein